MNDASLPQQQRQEVRERYAAGATTVTSGQGGTPLF
jgi:hypothetical protein